jgi:DNA-binding transcriptional MerR regulator
MKNQDYYEWMYLLTEARQLGLSDAEIRSFLKDMSKLNAERKAAEKKKNHLKLVFTK